jgi:hypothetical protein
MVGGLVLSQALTLFTTPVIYLYLDQFTGERRRQRAAEAARARAPAAPAEPDPTAVPELARGAV